jgi:hypothetical protein
VRDGQPRRTTGRRILLGHGLLVAALAVWTALEPWGSDPLDTTHALPSIALAVTALPSVVPLVASGVGGAVGRGTFLTLVVLLSWAEAVALHWCLNRRMFRQSAGRPAGRSSD